MPKKYDSQAGSLFRKDVLRMSEGYYTGDQPNPNIRAFVEVHGNNRKPLAETLGNQLRSEVEVHRTAALFGLHKYWSKKGYEAIQQYLAYFTREGDVVLDPFCGSGGVAVIAAQMGRHAISIDASPAATFITAGYCTPADPSELLSALHTLSVRLQPVVSDAYSTHCSDCDSQATILYIDYSTVFQCIKCLNWIPYALWQEGSVRKFRGRETPVLVCPHCSEALNTQQSKRKGFAPVLEQYACPRCSRKTKQRGFIDGEWADEDVLVADASRVTQKLQQLAKHAPTISLEGIVEPRLVKNVAKAGVKTVADLHDLKAAAVLWAIKAGIDELDITPGTRLHLLLAFSGILWTTSIQNRSGQAAVLDATYYVPHNSHRINAWLSFCKRVKLVSKMNSERTLPSGSVIISTQSATDLSSIASESIDYVFTDPPYGAKFQYGQLNLLWEAWLGFDRQWYKDELVVADHRKCDWQYWAQVFASAFREVWRVLKPGGFLTLCYHDTETATWALVQDIMAECGFVIVEDNGILAIDGYQKTYNQSTGEAVTKRDLIVNFRKPRLEETSNTLTFSGTEDAETFSDKVRTVIRDFLAVNPGSTKDRIYDEIISRMVRSGQMEAHDFEDLLRQVAEEVKMPVMKNLFDQKDPDLFGSHEIGRWYLRETELPEADAAENAREEAAAKKIGSFITGHLKKNLGDEGVHYSDLFEHYIYAVKDKPRRQLAEFLPDYFYKTEQGTWRLPVSGEEERAKREARVKGLGRRVKRYIAQLELGAVIPDHERPNDATLAEWIRHCKRAGLYEQGKLLYEKGGINPDNLSEEAMVNVEEDYQVCARMLARDTGKGQRRKGKEGSLL